MAERTRAVNEREKGPGVMGASGQRKGRTKRDSQTAKERWQGKAE